LDCPDGELSIVINDDDQIQAINKQYLNKDRPTNVISFAMQEGQFSQFSGNMLGDVIISIETAQKEADDAGIPFEQRFFDLLIHGILHIFGYDHERSEDELKMNEKAKELLKLPPLM